LKNRQKRAHKKISEKVKKGVDKAGVREYTPALVAQRSSFRKGAAASIKKFKKTKNSC
jgi:hypothetical protein